MIVLLLILLPLIGGLVTFFLKNEPAAKAWSLLVSFATMAVAIAGATMVKGGGDSLSYTAPWLGTLGSSFSIRLDGMSSLLCLLTGIAYPIIFLATWKNEYRNAHNFFVLMLLTQAGLIGVFAATDALLFYFFWELALVPVYFLCSGWGGERRIQATFKFFVYTFAGSVLMLICLIWLYFQTPDHSFSMASFYAFKTPPTQQYWVFWLMFIAF